MQAGAWLIYLFLFMSVASGISKECVYPIPSHGVAHKRHPVFVFADFAIRAKSHLHYYCIPKNCHDSLYIHRNKYMSLTPYR